MIIAHDYPGLKPISSNCAGKVLVLRSSKLYGRYQFGKMQLFRASGGFGCEADKLGTGIFGTHLYDGEECKRSRGDFIGELSDEAAAAVMQGTDTLAPLDPEDMVYMAIGTGGYWGKGKDRKAAEKECRRAGGRYTRIVQVWYCHAETYVGDFQIRWPKEAPAAELIWERK